MTNNKSCIKLMINRTPKQNRNCHIQQLHKINKTKQKAKEQKITVRLRDKAATKVKHIVHSSKREKAQASILRVMGQNSA